METPKTAKGQLKMDTASELNLSEVCRILWKRRAVFFILFSAVFLTVLLVSFLTPPTYRASAKLIIQREGSLFPVGIIPKVSDKGFYNTQKEMLSSGLILDRALQVAKDKRLVEDTDLGEFKQGVSVGYLNDSNILETRVELENEKDAVVLANSINSVFIDYHINTKTRLVDKSLEILSRETTSLRRDIELTEDRLKEFSDKEQLGFYQAQLPYYIGSIVALQKKNKLTEENIRRLQLEFYKTNRLLKGKDKKSLNKLIPRVLGQASGENATSPMGSSPWIQDIKIKLTNMETQLSTLLVEYTDEHPGVQGVRRKIASLKRGLNRELKGVLATHADYYDDYIRFLESQKKIVETEKRRYRSELDRISEDIDKAALRYIEFTTLSKNYGIKQSIYATFLQKQRDLELLREETSNPAISNIRIFESASLPLSKVDTNLPLNLFLGAFFGVFIGISGGLISERTEAKEKNLQAVPLEARFSGTERRAMSRMEIPLNVTYKLIGDASQMEHAASSEDISGTGIKIRVDKYISKGAQLDLEVHLNLNDSIKVKAEVMWMIPSEEKDMFQGGLHFVEIDPGEREKLINYLYGEHYLTETVT